jgi:hypothetical protein
MTSRDPYFGMPEVARFDIGRYVECDACGADLTDDTRTGGFIFSGHGYGPCCAERGMKCIKGYGEERYIQGTCTPGMAYADWIRAIRAQIPHGNEVRVFGSEA